MKRWPICLRLPAGGVDLVLPAALVQQVLSCEPVPLPPALAPGWQEVEGPSGDSVIRVRFVAPGEAPEQDWQARWIAVLRRRAGGSAPRHGLLLSAAPELLPPPGDGMQVVTDEDGPLPDALATVVLGMHRLMLPDLAALPAQEPAA